jgi:hypothetical protein
MTAAWLTTRHSSSHRAPFTAARRQLREFRKRCGTQYASCHEMVLRDELFRGLLTKPGGGPL